MINILSTEAMRGIAERVTALLQDKQEDARHIRVNTTTFDDGEVFAKIEDSVRHTDLYVFHSMRSPNPSEGTMTLLVLIDAIGRASPHDVTLVLPHMTYLRQDRKEQSRVPISGSMLAYLIEAHGCVDRVMTMDMHSGQAQGFFKLPVDNLEATPLQVSYFKDRYKGDLSNVVVVSPDVGGAKRAQDFQRALDGGASLGVINKARPKPDEAHAQHYIGDDPKGKDVIIKDDLIDTGGTLVSAAKILRVLGAHTVYVAATHGVFSTRSIQATQRLREAQIRGVVTNTIPRPASFYEENKDWLTVLPIEHLLAEAIYENSRPGGSVSSLFKSS